MKMIVAIVAPARLEQLKRALSHAWISGITVSEVAGFRLDPGQDGDHRGAEHELEGVPRVRVELVVPEPLVPRLLHDLARAVRTGEPGDGKLFVGPVESAVRIRTGERDEHAL